MKKRLVVIVFLAVGIGLGLSANAFAVGGSNAECPGCPVGAHPQGPAIIGDFTLTCSGEGDINGLIYGATQKGQPIVDINISLPAGSIEFPDETFFDCDDFAALRARDLNDFTFEGSWLPDGSEIYQNAFFILMGARKVVNSGASIDGTATILYAVGGE